MRDKLFWVILVFFFFDVATYQTACRIGGSMANRFGAQITVIPGSGYYCLWKMINEDK